MVHIGTYLQIIELSEGMVKTYGQYPDKSDNGYRVAQMIYGAAFAALINEGMPYTVRNDVIVIETDGHVYGYRHQPERPVRKETKAYEVKTPSNSGLYGGVQVQDESETESQNVELPEEKDEGDFDEGTELYRQGEKEISSYIEESGKGTAADPEDDRQPEKQDAPESRKDVQDDKEERVQGQIEQSEERQKDQPVSEVQGPEGKIKENKEDQESAQHDGAVKTHAPEEMGNSAAQKETDDKASDEEDNDPAASVIRAEDYTMQKQVVEISNGIERIPLGVLSMPLDLSVEKPRILVGLMIDKGNVKVVGSKKKSNRITADVGGYPLVIEGRMTEGGYTASCSLPKQYENTDIKIRVLQKKTYGNGGHAIMENDKKTLRIHFMPIGFGNDPDYGVGHFAYLIESEGGETCGSTVLTKGRICFRDDGREWAVCGEWKENATLGVYADEIG